MRGTGKVRERWKGFRVGFAVSFLGLFAASTGWAAPTVTDWYPADGSNAPPDAVVTATFSEAMDPASITTGSVTVSRFVGLARVSAGLTHAVALRKDGTMVAWGDNSVGQCGFPPGLSGVKTLDGGTGNTIALKHDGTVVAWGDNYWGQCDVPAGLADVATISVGSFHVLALKNDGTVAAWGNNSGGQCDVPEGLCGVTAIAAGYDHSVALKSDGTLVAWGNNVYGPCTIPSGLSGVVAVAAGEHYTVALKDDGTVVAWGFNYYGRTSVPYGLSGVTAIAAADRFTVALRGDGTVVTWGDYQMAEFFNVPAGLSGVTAITTNFAFTVALQGDGTPIAWGSNNYGQCTVAPSLYESAMEGTVAYDNSTRTASFTPSSPLVDATFFATVTGEARSAAGVPLAADVRWSFLVDGVPPAVAMDNVVPPDGAVDVPLNQVITIPFTEDIQVAQPESNIFLYDEKRLLPVERTLSVNGNVLTVTPTELIKNTTYSLTIPGFSIKDQAGNEMATDKIFYFTTVKH